MPTKGEKKEDKRRKTHTLDCLVTEASVRDNRARPEGSISKGYGTEEVIEFCVDFIPDLKPIGVPQSRHEGRLSGKCTVGKNAKYVGTGIL